MVFISLDRLFSLDDFWFFWFVILFFSLFGLLCFAVEYFLIVGFDLFGQVVSFDDFWFLWLHHLYNILFDFIHNNKLLILCINSNFLY